MAAAERVSLREGLVAASAATGACVSSACDGRDAGALRGLAPLRFLLDFFAPVLRVARLLVVFVTC